MNDDVGFNVSARAQVRRSVPEYKDIVSGARLVEFFATLLQIAGWLAVLSGLAAVALGGLMEIGIVADPFCGATTMIHSPLLAGIIVMISTFISSIPLFLWAIMLRLVSSLSRAMRDIARNSFR